MCFHLLVQFLNTMQCWNRHYLHHILTRHNYTIITSPPQTIQKNRTPH
jgi:hypothetical protein